MARPLPRPGTAPATAATDTGAWMDAPVSSRSRFGDDLWLLDVFVAGRPPSQKRLGWDLPLPEAACITGAQHVGLVRAAKQFLWSMAVPSPGGRRRWSPSTLRSSGQMLQVMVGWMAMEGVASFRAVTPQTIDRLVGWLRARPGRKGGLCPATVGNYLKLVRFMFLQRAKLDDAPAIDPLPGSTPHEVAGVSAADLGSIPFIPDAVAVDLLSKALSWVELHSAGIIAAAEVRGGAWDVVLARGLTPLSRGEFVSRAVRRAAATGPDGLPIGGRRALQKCVRHLSTACFVVIAGFVGMRVSEILSMQAGAVERHPIGETGAEQAYVAARLFKGSDEPLGRPELWAVPEPVIRAVECMERLSALWRGDADGTDLFVAITGAGGYASDTCITNCAVAVRLRAFAQHVGVPLHEGEVWHLSPHQFRKTFARFVGRGDRSGLLALAAHFKHVSVAMTSRGYVGTDHELHELIDDEARAETAVALDRLLSSDALGGLMGERIVGRNHAFRGRAGEQVRRDYIRFLLEETDLRVRGCDYGWCVFQAETAKCGGETAPNETRRSASVCAGCTNFCADDPHRPFWQDRRGRNEELFHQSAGYPLVQAVAAEAMEECDLVLRGIEGGQGGGGAGQGAPG